MNPIAIAIVAFLLSLAATAAPARPDVSAFASAPAFGQARLSPDGRHVAIERIDEISSTLVILDADTLAPTSELRFPPHQGVHGALWANNDTLLVTRSVRGGGLETPRRTGEVYALSVDGKRQQYLYGFQAGASKRQRGRAADMGTATVIDTLREDPHRVLLMASDWQARDQFGHRPVVLRVDLRTAEREQITRLPLANPAVVTDLRGEIRYAWGLDDDDQPATFRYHGPDDWRRLPAMPGPLGSLRPWQFLPDHRRFLAKLSERGEADCLFLLDADSDQRTKVACEGDFAVGALMPSSIPGLPLALVTAVGTPSVRLLGANEADTSLYETLGRAFAPALVRFIDVSDDGRRILFEVASDRDPGRVYLHDRQDNRSRPVFARRAGLAPERMAGSTPFSLLARDGTRLHGFLTRPAAPAGRLPLVVVPHGGPHGAYDSWFFDAETQWLAANGYAVLRVNFRGSGGFGLGFERLGYRQWGAAIQDDIIDATRWAIDQGHADGRRVCIAGGSFGAYSALMSSARAPDLFRCAIGYAGVYDLDKMFSRGDIIESQRGNRYLDQALGDDATERESFSPRRQAERIRAAVLLVHGTSDRRTPLAHASEMRAAMARAGNPVQWLAVPNEGHGFAREKNRRLYLQTLVAFLDRHIGAPLAPAPP